MIDRFKAAIREFNKKPEPKVEEKPKVEESKDDPLQPRIEVIACGIDPIKGLHYELDWNDAFIKYLRDSGYTGSADETVVGKWMVDLWRQTSDELNSKVRNQYE